MKRKLTTVLCADVHQYGRMMSRDESATLDRLNRYRGIMNELFERHEGRKVNTWGDGVIAEFPSVVESVRCAVEIQDAITAENQDLPDERQMWFRIGINLGDVMEDESDIYGDGVNVASRLEALAEPGGIMVSESVYNFTHKQLAIGFDFAGENQVKDSDTPVVGYRVRTGRNAPPEEPQHIAEASQDAKTNRKKTNLEVAADKLLMFREWLEQQDRSVRFSVAMIGFFLAINVLFSGIATPWFIFPSFPFALHIFMKNRKRKREEQS